MNMVVVWTRRALLCAVLLALTAPTASSQGAAPPRDEADLSGLYACEGIGPDGASYRGTVDIYRHDGTYQLLWTMSPRERYLGLGIVSGDVLAVTYSGGLPGVVAYRVARTADGLQLAGSWTVAHADGAVFRETLTRIGENAGHPHFRVVPGSQRITVRGGWRPA